LGFGNLGEYGDSLHYFEKALRVDPSNKIALAYKDYVTKIKAKYYPDQVSIISLKEKEQIESKGQSVPSWVKSNAKWWSEDKIPQMDFIRGIQYLVGHNIIKVTYTPIGEKKTSAVPDWVKSTAGWWADNIISDKEFLSSIEFLISNRIIQIEIDSSDSLAKRIESELQLIDEPSLKKHLFEVSKKIAKEKRYIEFPNPSWALKKKYLRDVEQWNLEQQIQTGLKGIPDPTFTEEDGNVIMHYKVYINDQPPGLPFDYKPTLDKSLGFWASQNFTLNDKPLVFDFSYTTLKSDGNVWVTWIVRDIDALGHATIGKGVVEVTIGNYACNGDFELLDMDTVEYIMKHEIGHSIGLTHISDPDNIMYPSVDPSYGFCIISDE
ncbi:MAG: matrixin family metalloprotease, partial [Nitrosopumilaceae archaeon]